MDLGAWRPFPPSQVKAPRRDHLWPDDHKSAAKGQVLLTGSARIGRGALGGGDPLAGRSVSIQLRPFTQSELSGSPNRNLERWWDRDFESAVYDETGLQELFSRLIRGGLPTVALSDTSESPAEPSDVKRMIEAYVDGVVTASVAGSRTNQAGLLRTFRYLASNPGQILNIQRGESDLSVRAETARNHIDICEASFLLEMSPAHRPKEHQTLTDHPRVFVSDVGLAAWAADTSIDRLIRDPSLSGSMLENFVAGELAAQASWLRNPARLLHWRDSKSGHEVDIVLRRQDGALLAVEVKSSSKVSIGDARGIKTFAESAGEQMVAGVIVYSGRATIQLDERVWAVPVQALMSG